MLNKILVDSPEIETQASSLRQLSSKLKGTGDNYKKMMDDMSNGWKGSSGKSFSEASGRVEAGFVINRSVLEQMIYDVTAANKEIVEQDTRTGKTVAAASID